MSMSGSLTTPPPASSFDRRPGWTVVSVVVITLSLVLFVVVVLIMYYFTRGYGPDVDRDATAKQVAELRAADRELLSTYGWVDRKQGVTRVPIERAMELIVAESGTASPEGAVK